MRKVPPALWAVLLRLSITVTVTVTVSVTMGPASISVDAVWGPVLQHLGFGESRLPELMEAVVWELRLPRGLTAACVGAGLALSGMVMQAITRNALADPYLGAVSVLLLGAAVLLPVAALVGALAAPDAGVGHRPG